MPSWHSPAPARGACELLVAKTGDEMVVHESHRLHERIADRRAHESETALSQVLAQRVRFARACGNLPRGTPRVLERLPVHEAPYVRVEGAELVLNGEEGPGIGHRALHFQAIANDARVLEQTGNLRGSEPRDPRRIEVGERAPVVRALPED